MSLNKVKNATSLCSVRSVAKYALGWIEAFCTSMQVATAFCRSMALFALVFLSFQSQSLQAQVIITQSPMPYLRFTAPTLLNISLINTSTNVVSGHLESVLTSERGEVVCVVKSQQLELQPNSTRNVNGASTMEEYSYGEGAVALYAMEQGQLLAGTYQWCVQFHAPALEVSPENCLPIISSFQNFLNLLQPDNRAVVDTKTPVLIWTSGTNKPFHSASERFELLLVRLENDQTASEAIVENAPLFLLPNATKTVVYPPFAEKLEYGEKYAWKVTHYVGDEMIQSSDVWSFTLAEWEDPRDLKYVDTKKSNQGLIEVYDSFYFRFDERYASESMTIKIRDSKGEVVPLNVINDKSQESGVKENGPNGFRLNLTPYSLKAGQYTISILNGKGEQFDFLIHYNR